MFPGYKWLQFSPPPLKTDRVIEEFWNDLLAFFEDPLNCVLIFSSTLSSNDFCTNFKVLKFLLLFPSIKMDIATSNINSLVTYQRYFLGEVPQKSGRVCLLLNYQHHWIIILYVRSTRAVQLLLRLVWSGLVSSGLFSKSVQTQKGYKVNWVQFWKSLARRAIFSKNLITKEIETRIIWVYWILINMKLLKGSNAREKCGHI